LQSGSTLSNFRDVGVGLNSETRYATARQFVLKGNLYLINYNHTRTQWTTKGNREARSSCSCDRGLQRYLRNFGGGGLNPPKPPPQYATALTPGSHDCKVLLSHPCSFSYSYAVVCPVA